MTLPPEIASVKLAGEILVRAGHPDGYKMLHWIDACCPLEGRDFFSLFSTGHSWSQEVRPHLRDEHLRSAAKLLRDVPTDELPSRMRRLYRDYRTERFPSVRAEDECPSDHNEIEALFWRALKVWPHDVRTDQMRQILSE